MIKFSGYILLFDIVVLVVGGIPVFIFAGIEPFIALLISFLVTSLLAIASYTPFTRIQINSTNRYMTAILIGMMIRMVFMGISLVIVFIFTELHQIAFTVGLLFSYIFKSIIETYTIIRKAGGQTSAS